MPDELSLGKLARAGDRAALGELLRAHQKAAFAFALSLLGNVADAEDACGEAFLRAVRGIRTFRPGGSFKAWLLCLARSAALDQLRSDRARRAREESKAMAENKPAAAAAAARSAEAGAAVLGALAALDERYRLPVMLHYNQGLSHAEIAEVLEVPPGTVGVHIARGLEKLREALARAGFTAALVVAGLKELPLPNPPASLGAYIAAALREPALAQGGAVSAGAKGGMAVKVIAGVVLAGALAGVVAMSVGPATGNRQPATPLASPPAAKGGPLVKEYFAFALPGGYLNGPRKEALIHRGGFFPAEADAKGNIYGVGVLGGTLIRCIRADGQVETITGDDFCMADFMLAEGPASALGTPPEGFNFGLAAPTGLMVQGVPAEGEGKGSLLLTMKNQVFKIWKNAEKGNRWWFKRIVGGGKTKLPQARGQSVPALEAGFELYGVQWDKDNKLILWADAGSGYRYDGEKLTCILSRADYADKALKDSKGQPSARQFFLAADGAVYLGYYFSSDEAYAGKVPAIWRLSPDGSKAEPFAKNSAAKTYDGDALTGAHFFCGPHFGSNSVSNPPDIFLTRAHDEATARRIKQGRTSRLCWDGEWREVSGELDKQLILLPGLTRGGPDAVFGSGVSSAGNPREDYRMYVIKGIDFGKPTVKEGGK